MFSQSYLLVARVALQCPDFSRVSFQIKILAGGMYALLIYSQLNICHMRAQGNSVGIPICVLLVFQRSLHSFMLH